MPRHAGDLMARYGFACATAVGFLLVLAPVVFCSKADRMLWRAAYAYSCRELPAAEDLAAESLRQDPESHAAAVVAGDAASGLHEHFKAIEYYQLVPEDAGDLAVLARRGLGERWLMLGDMEQAEECFRFVLDHWPDDFLSNKRYSYLMQIQGRTWESVAPAMRMIQQGLFGASEIHIVGCPQNRFIMDERFVDMCKQFRPDDWRPMLAEANLELLQDNNERAESLMRQVIEQAPEVVEPCVQLGRILIDSGRWQEFIDLDQHLPEGADAHTGIWMNRGLLAEQLGEHEAAARCLYQALDIAPNYVEANYMLSQVLVQLGQPALAESFGIRAKTLARIELTIPEFYAEPTPERVQRLMADFESVGRYWEAAAMSQFAFRYEWETHQWIKDGLFKYGQLLRDSGAELSPRGFLASVEHLSVLPLPEWSRSQVLTQRLESGVGSGGGGSIRFEDRAQETGLAFTYFNGSVAVRGMEHIFETTGGGVVTFDYDQDLWPDLYLAQGAPIWEGDDPVQRTDCVFRNAAGQFRESTLPAGLGDEGFSQGATAGDYNNDGFQDLYVCNLYGNRFYENNGDGTFSEITQQTGTAGDEWSLSCVLVDLNHDTVPDLYVVNYLDRDSVFDQRCRRNGKPLTCAPTLFPAAQDRVYLGLGDGRFQEVTHECGIVQPEGKGLVILAADFDGSGNTSLFVGNDTAPNFLFLNHSQPAGPLRFQEAGIISGLALDGSGRSVATMGVAFGDVNGDRRDDLFVTNFYNSGNRMYFQVSPGQFEDQSRKANLYEPSLPLLGFGTHFVDADLDGRLDLFVTNGHVDRTEATGEPDEMPPHYYHNMGEGRFQLLDGSKIGRYFEGLYLGRTVSRLDWNRDLLDDLCVLHLFHPVALVTNETKEVGNAVRITLRGTSCSRDAIGAKVHLTAGQTTWSHQLVAGDGYMTSNERYLTFGLGSIDTIDSLSIEWPGGVTQVFDDVSINQEYLFVQGRKMAVRLP